MKKLFTLTFLVLMIANAGCVKPGGGGTNPVLAIPDIANFELKAASTFVAGAASTISILSSSLGDGTFNVNFNITGADNLSNQTATLTMSGGSGTFNTPALSTAGQNSITINSISNSAGGSANVTSNNTYSFSDSTGLMTATASIGTSSFRAMHVTASLAGSLLTIDGVMWTPKLTTITVHLDYFNHTMGTTYFNMNDLTPGDIASTFNGGASFGIAGGGTAVSDLSAHGSVTITSLTPLIKGTFSFTNTDSSTISGGNFMCTAP